MTALPANMRTRGRRGLYQRHRLRRLPRTKLGYALPRRLQSAPARWWPRCIREGKTLEELTLDEFKQCSDLFAEDVYTAIDLTTCCEGRTSYGGPTKASVLKQVALVKAKLE